MFVRLRGCEAKRQVVEIRKKRQKKDKRK